MVSASSPRTPSTETTKGVKCLRRSKHDFKYLSFFSFSCASKHPLTDLLCSIRERASVFVMRTSKMHSVCFSQNPRIARSPLSPVSARRGSVGGGIFDASGSGSAVRVGTFSFEISGNSENSEMNLHNNSSWFGFTWGWGEWLGMDVGG